jgi:hypothetical protein
MNLEIFQDKIPIEFFKKTLVDFLHYSEYLLHLDISGMGLNFDSCKYIAFKGIRKSRTLISIHMSGLGLKND